MTHTLTPAELAAFDQSWQTVERTIDNLVGIYREKTGDGEATREADLLCFIAALQDLLRGTDTAALLACAVDRLARKEPA